MPWRSRLVTLAPHLAEASRQAIAGGRALPWRQVARAMMRRLRDHGFDDLTFARGTDPDDPLLLVRLEDGVHAVDLHPDVRAAVARRPGQARVEARDITFLRVHGPISRGDFAALYGSA